MDEREARKLLEDAKGRRYLWEEMWKASHSHEAGRPVPTAPDDEVIQEELRRILFPKRKKFLGLF
jgi:hypothetical protein